MEMLHTPEELVRLSNMAHMAEAIVLFIIAGLLLVQAFGYFKSGWKRYLWPAMGLLASLILAYALFVGHYDELGKAWRVITTDMQQKQHFQIGVLIGIGAIAEVTAIKLKKKWLHLVFPLAVGIIGVLFIGHPQHGTEELAKRGLLIHRIAGTALIIAALAQAGSVLRAKSQKTLLIITAVALAVSAAAFTVYREPLMDHGSMNASTQSHPTYSLSLMSGKSYDVNKPTTLHFAILDQDNNTLKAFDTVHEKKLHLIVVRKDRTNFQHVHPTLDEASGMFMIERFSFPTDGDYRVYADFTPSDAQKDEMGMKLPATPYQDVQVGDISKYTPQPLTANKLTSSVNGFDTSIFFAPPDDSPGAPDTNLYAGQENSIAISINKDGQPFKNLQNYLGALGHMVVLGDALEFIHAHPQTVDESNQGGVIVFNVNFPKAGRYKLFLQTRANGQVTTNDFAVSVIGDSQQKNPPQPSEDMDMMNMGH